MWDERSGTLRHRLSGHEAPCRDVAWHPNGERLASIDARGELRIWDPESGEQVFALTLPGPAAEIEWHPDGRRLGAIVGDRVYLLDARPPR